MDDLGRLIKVAFDYIYEYFDIKYLLKTVNECNKEGK